MCQQPTHLAANNQTDSRHTPQDTYCGIPCHTMSRCVAVHHSFIDGRTAINEYYIITLVDRPFNDIGKVRFGLIREFGAKNSLAKSFEGVVIITVLQTYIFYGD